MFLCSNVTSWLDISLGAFKTSLIVEILPKNNESAEFDFFDTLEAF